MFVPIVPHVTVVDKNIIYSDTVLPVKDSGNNLKISSISNVNESHLEECLKTIFKFNPNVIFNTIQYSKSSKKVYFYTNQAISTKEWENSRISTYEPITNSSKILEEVKNILVSEPNKSSACISLYDIAQLMKRKNDELESDLHSFEKYLDYVIESKYGFLSSLVVYDFDYIKDELCVGFKYVHDYKKIIFAKEDEDLYVKEDESCRGKDILVALEDSLSKLYDNFIQYKDIKGQAIYKIKSVNSNFLVNISSYGVSIFVEKFPNSLLKEFKLESPSYQNEYNYDCNSNAVIDILRGNEKEIFKRIFVKLEDCPKWSQPILCEIRQNQLTKEQEIERKIQKRLELKRKFFSFLKK